MDVVITCPLGSECEEIKDGKLHRCRWYKELMGKNPNTGEETKQWDCAMAWQPLLQTETSGAMVGVAASFNSMRNESIVRQDKLLDLVDKGALSGIEQGDAE